jgi:hypothetical protein
MKISTVYHVKPYRIYVKFIKKCKEKTYNAKLVLHRHHIIPKHIWNSKDNKEIVYLSVVDHIKAHLLLANCVDKGTYEYAANLRSARILNKKSIRDKKTLAKIKKTYCGINNPFYGKKHSVETKKLIGDITSKLFKNKSYKDRYGTDDLKEKKKRSDGVKLSWSNMTDEAKEIRSKNISASLMGKSAWNKGLAGPKKKYLLLTPDNITVELLGRNSLFEYLKNINGNNRRDLRINITILTSGKSDKGYKLL